MLTFEHNMTSTMIDVYTAITVLMQSSRAVNFVSITSYSGWFLKYMGGKTTTTILVF